MLIGRLLVVVEEFRLISDRKGAVKMASGGSQNLDEAIKRTQESFKSLIRKPPMTEKLLARPPFRYLHDVLMEV